MARKAMIEKEKRRAHLAQLKFQKRQELKKIIKSLDTDEADREEAMRKLGKMSKNSSVVRGRNRCQFTGRSRGYLRRFQMSRLCFRQMANAGMIPGIIKASW